MCVCVVDCFAFGVDKRFFLPYACARERPCITVRLAVFHYTPHSHTQLIRNHVLCSCVFLFAGFFFLFDLLPGEQTLDVRDKSCSYSKQIEEGDMKIWKIGHGPKIMKKILRKYRLLQGTEI